MAIFRQPFAKQPEAAKYGGSAVLFPASTLRDWAELAAEDFMLRRQLSLDHNSPIAPDVELLDRSNVIAILRAGGLHQLCGRAA